jgi:hypothetical protein
MTVIDNRGRICQSTITSSLEVFDLLTVDGISVYDYVLAKGSTFVTQVNIKTISSGIAIADAVVVGWQLDDLSHFPSNYVSSLVQGIGDNLMPSASSSTPVPASSPTLSQQTELPPAQSKALDTGAKAGIGAAIGIGALLAGVGILLLYLRIKRRVTATTVARPETSIPEMEDQDKTLTSRKWFLRGKWRSEHAGVERIQELDSRSVNVMPGPPVELDASVAPQDGEIEVRRRESL